MIKKIVVLGVLVLVVAYAGAEIWINNAAERAIARKLEQDHPEAEDIEARVSIPLLLSVFGTSAIKRVGATATEVPMAPLPVLGTVVVASRVNAELSGVRIDRDALLQDKQLLVRSIEHIEITTEISAAEASKALAVIPGAEVAFEFLPGSARVRVAGAIIGGTFEVQEAGLAFLPSNPLGAVPVLPVDNVLFAACTSAASVEVEDGRIVVTCSQDNPPVP